MTGKKGYSLLESILTLIALSTIFLIFIPGISAFSRWKALEKNASALEATILRARFLALSSNERQRVYFNVSGNCYYIHSDANNNRSFDKGEKIIGPFFLTDGVTFSKEDILGPPSSPTTNPPSPVTFNRQIASCSPTGLWANPGTIYLKDKDNNHLAITLRINGFISKYWWDKKNSVWIKF